VSVTFPWISPRFPVSAALENGRVTVLNCSDPTVKGTGVPIAPFALKNEIMPVQDGADAGVTTVPDDTVAVFTTVIDTVSLLPSPTGGNR
jgi:hypothetical protein